MGPRHAIGGIQGLHWTAAPPLPIRYHPLFLPLCTSLSFFDFLFFPKNFKEPFPSLVFFWIKHILNHGCFFIFCMLLSSVQHPVYSFNFNLTLFPPPFSSFCGQNSRGLVHAVVTAPNLMPTRSTPASTPSPSAESWRTSRIWALVSVPSARTPPRPSWQRSSRPTAASPEESNWTASRPSSTPRCPSPRTSAM